MCIPQSWPKLGERRLRPLSFLPLLPIRWSEKSLSFPLKSSTHRATSRPQLFSVKSYLEVRNSLCDDRGDSCQKRIPILSWEAHTRTPLFTDPQVPLWMLQYFISACIFCSAFFLFVILIVDLISSSCIHRLSWKMIGMSRNKKRVFISEERYSTPLNRLTVAKHSIKFEWPKKEYWSIQLATDY